MDIRVFEALLGYRDVGVLVVRLVVGYILVYHGWPKLLLKTACAEESVATLRARHFPAPEIIVRMIGGIEAVVGALYILGISVQGAAAAVSILMVVLLFGKVVVMRRPFSGTHGYEFVLLLLAASIFLVLNGAGVYALGH
jgi:uncharacterized membrane protein YphA (DoxX/SURF4 family)